MENIIADPEWGWWWEIWGWWNIRVSRWWQKCLRNGCLWWRVKAKCLLLGGGWKNGWNTYQWLRLDGRKQYCSSSSSTGQTHLGLMEIKNEIFTKATKLSRDNLLHGASKLFILSHLFLSKAIHSQSNHLLQFSFSYYFWRSKIDWSGSRGGGVDSDNSCVLGCGFI